MVGDLSTLLNARDSGFRGLAMSLRDHLKNHGEIRAYYDSRRMTFVSAGDPRTEWFKPLTSLHGFRAEALTELAANPDRARYNLPVGVEDLEYLSADSVFLPAYVIRAVQRGNVRYLAYTQIGEMDTPRSPSYVSGTPR
jgi:hypothetical protein